mmetsp:Transcript_64635/g.200416  ORF Transcript_64635/g.200416 Transcript_64635/m.200416 type:complete len:587 (-) Transcript_64635:3-1763(-)
MAVLQLHGGGEVPQQRGHRLSSKAWELEGLLRLAQLQDLRGHHLLSCASVEEAHDHGDEQRPLPPLLRRQVGLACTDLLLKLEGVGACAGVPRALGLHLGRPRLKIPLLEQRQVAAIGVRHGCAEVVTGYRGAVVTLKVEVHALPEAGAAQQGLVHADHLGPLAVDRGGVEIVHGDVTLGADRVRHGPPVLRELPRSEEPHLLDPLHCRAAHVSRELLIPENSEAFLECQLEPVAARHSVPCPVVEVLMPNHALDTLVVTVRRRVRPGECERGVEDVQPLVFHGTHVEIVHGHDVVDVQVVLKTETLLVPLHGALQGPHRVIQLVHVLPLREDRELHQAAGGRREAPLERAQISGHDCEEVAGLRVGVLEDGEVPRCVLGAGARLDPVAVPKEHGALGPLGLDADAGVLRHHVRAVGEVGEAAKALCLHLCAVHAATVVQAAELRVLFGLHCNHGVQPKRLHGAHSTNDHAVRSDLVALWPLEERLPLSAARGNYFHRSKLQVFAIQHELRARSGHFVVQFAHQPGLHLCLAFEDLHVQLDLSNPVVWRAIVLAELLHRLLLGRARVGGHSAGCWGSRPVASARTD